MRREPIWRAFRSDLVGGLAEGQCLRLRKYIGDQHVVVPTQRVDRPDESDEIAGYETRALMDQLIERMLAVSTRLSPKDRPGVVVDLHAIEHDVLAVALHGELLEIRRKPLQVLFVGQNGMRLCAEEIIVPDAD